jgi:hypothetical protein
LCIFKKSASITVKTNPRPSAVGGVHSSSSTRPKRRHALSY